MFDGPSPVRVSIVLLSPQRECHLHNVPVRRLGVPLSGLVLVALVFLVSASPDQAKADDGNGSIVSIALRSLGTHGGQCWEFMQHVVEEATGRHVSGDYRQAYFAAGAIEMTANTAAPGDIIQLTDPDGGDAIEPHSAIILKNLGNHRFDVIDSNQAWDEIVRLRPNYAPYDLAAQRGGVIHIYRMPRTAAPLLKLNDPSLLSASHSWTAGQTVVVTKEEGCLNLRESPSLDAKPIACLPKGATATATGETRESDTYTWAHVVSAAGGGWLATAFIAPATWVNTDGFTLDTSVGGAMHESALSASADQMALSATAAPVKLGWLPPLLSRTARVDASSGCLNLRATAATTSQAQHCLPAGSTVSVLGEPTAGGPPPWTHVRLADGSEGWAPSEFLLRVPLVASWSGIWSMTPFGGR